MRATRRVFQMDAGRRRQTGSACRFFCRCGLSWLKAAALGPLQMNDVRRALRKICGGEDDRSGIGSVDGTGEQSPCTSLSFVHTQQQSIQWSFKSTHIRNGIFKVLMKATTPRLGGWTS
eukprot:GHVU01051972.1.p2 GENE.GHVU01051972.1~~GHVU01051972.1.p2  ORF type:complete len:119 (+),score=11.69 GHVU01051972.1:57-413(+)